MVMSSNKSHSTKKLSFCGTVWTQLISNLATSSYTRHEKNKVPPSGGGCKLHCNLKYQLIDKATVDLFGCKKVWFCMYSLSQRFTARQEVHSLCTFITQVCNSQVISMCSHGVLQLTVLGNRQYNFPSLNKLLVTPHLLFLQGAP